MPDAQITAEIFEKATGAKPANDDLDRCNCPDVGKSGHLMCGWDNEANLPGFKSPNLAKHYLASLKKKENQQ